MSNPINKLNQLAFIKKSLRPINIGKIVNCKKYLGYYSKGDKINISGELYQAFDTDHYWIIESNSEILETQFGKSKEAYSMDSWLTPIPPLEDEDSTESQELTEDDLLTA